MDLKTSLSLLQSNGVDYKTPMAELAQGKLGGGEDMATAFKAMLEQFGASLGVDSSNTNAQTAEDSGEKATGEAAENAAVTAPQTPSNPEDFATYFLQGSEDLMSGQFGELGMALAGQLMLGLMGDPRATALAGALNVASEVAENLSEDAAIAQVEGDANNADADASTDAEQSA